MLFFILGFRAPPGLATHSARSMVASAIACVIRASWGHAVARPS